MGGAWNLKTITQTFTEFNVFQACSDAVVKMIISSSASASLHCFLFSLCTILQTDWLQVAFLGVVGGYGVQTSILVQSLGSIGFIVNVMSHFLQILEVRPERRHRLLVNYIRCFKQGRYQSYCVFLNTDQWSIIIIIIICFGLIE